MKWPWNNEREHHFPTLPAGGFLRGRAATVADIDAGDAVFCQQSNDGVSASPWSIAIPQYALWRDESGAIVPSILVQAEAHIHEPDGEPIFGLRRLDGSEVVATGSEVELLGTKPPA